MFSAEHHVMILSSLPKVVVDVSLRIEEGRLLDPVDNVDFGRNVAIFLQRSDLHTLQNLQNHNSNFFQER